MLNDDYTNRRYAPALYGGPKFASGIAAMAAKTCFTRVSVVRCPDSSCKHGDALAVYPPGLRYCDNACTARHDPVRSMT